MTNTRLKTFSAWLSKVPDFLIWFWLFFTTSLVIWWWIFSLQSLDDVRGYAEDPELFAHQQLIIKEEFQRRHNMLFWEGAILVGLIAGGGGSLLLFLHRDRKKNQQLKTFFANFSHDLKTSIARLRLDTELLAEKVKIPTEHLDRFKQDHARLETQLENSLYVANYEHFQFVMEKVRLSEILQSLRHDFDQLSFSLKQDAEVFADRRALLSIFRNLMQNSLLHGHAQSFYIEPTVLNEKELALLCSDDGAGSKLHASELGRGFVLSASPQSNGIGLFITKQLIESMGGQIFFRGNKADTSDLTGFMVEIHLVGQLTPRANGRPA